MLRGNCRELIILCSLYAVTRWKWLEGWQLLDQLSFRWDATRYGLRIPQGSSVLRDSKWLKLSDRWGWRNSSPSGWQESVIEALRFLLGEFQVQRPSCRRGTPILT